MKINLIMWLYATVFMLLFGFSFWACSVDNKLEKQARELAEVLQKELQNEKNTKVQLSTYTSFTWDHVYLATPYADVTANLKDQGITATAINSFNIVERDDINLLVFISENKVTKTLPIQRGIIDLANTENILLSSHKAHIVNHTNEVYLLADQ